MNKFQRKHYWNIVSEIHHLCDIKSRDYSDEMIAAGKEDNITQLGTKGVYVRMVDKMARLHKMIWLEKTNDVKLEGLEDALKDLANYAIISLMLIRKVWREK